MKISPQSRGCAIMLSLALVVGVAPAAVADEVVDPAAALTLTAPGLLTLPAADGVRDVTSVQVTSDVSTSVAFTITSSDGETVYSTPAPVDLTDENLHAATVEIAVAGLPAGPAVIHATPASGEPISVPLTVGSGKPQTVKQSLSPSTIYTWSGATNRTTTVTVTARDETAETVPFSGKVVAKTGTTTKSFSIASKTGAAAAVKIAATSLPYGTATVTSTVSGAGGPAVSSASASLAVKSVSVSSTKIATSLGTLYPAKDGFRDAAKISVSSKTTTGATIAARGTVKITRSGKTVKSWTLTSTKSWSASWDGRVSSKIVPGTYKVTVSIKGPQGTTKSASTSIVVKNGKLVTRTTSKWVEANAVLKKYVSFDEYERGYCTSWTDGDVDCDGYNGYYGDGVISLIAVGGFSVPSAVQSAQKFGSARARITLSTVGVQGAAAWGYGRPSDSTDRTGTVKKGDYNLGWTSLPATTKRLDLSVALGEYSYFWADKLKIEYQYKVMVY